jgi:hypothetical protein
MYDMYDMYDMYVYIRTYVYMYICMRLCVVCLLLLCFLLVAFLIFLKLMLCNVDLGGKTNSLLICPLTTKMMRNFNKLLISH